MKYFKKIMIPITCNVLKQSFIKCNVVVTASEKNNLLGFLVSRFASLDFVTYHFFRFWKSFQNLVDLGYFSGLPFFKLEFQPLNHFERYKKFMKTSALPYKCHDGLNVHDGV